MTFPLRPPGRRDAQATRRRLLVAALELFTTTGFRATTTPMLAERAGIAEGTIYRHFTGKDELLNVAYAEVQAWALGILQEPTASRSTPADQLRQVGRRIFDEAARNAARVRMFFRRGDERYLDEASRAAGQRVREGLSLIVASGKSDGLVRSGPAELWAGVWLALVGFAAERIAGGEWTPEHAQATLVLDAAWDAIAAR